MDLFLVCFILDHLPSNLFWCKYDVSQLIVCTPFVIPFITLRNGMFSRIIFATEYTFFCGILYKKVCVIFEITMWLWGVTYGKASSGSREPRDAQKQNLKFENLGAPFLKKLLLSVKKCFLETQSFAHPFLNATYKNLFFLVILRLQSQNTSRHNEMNVIFHFVSSTNGRSRNSNYIFGSIVLSSCLDFFYSFQNFFTSFNKIIFTGPTSI